MKSVEIKLLTIKNVQDFISVVCRYDFEIDLKSGRYTVDAKSIMGIFSLDLVKPITLLAYTESEEEWAAFAQDIKAFIV